MLRAFSRHKRLLRHAPAMLGAIVVAVFVALQYLLYVLDRPLRLDAPVTVEMREGANLTRFLADLQARGILDEPRLLRLYARLGGVGNAVRAGEYRLEPGITQRQILQKLLRGDVILYAVTIVEGMNLRQVLAHLREQPRLVNRIDPQQPGQLHRLLGIEDVARPLEGAFFPDTYQYHAGNSDLDILDTAYRRMQRILEEEWQARADGLPYRNAYEALIMASLIEKETGLASERPDIAGVFVRRLQRGMLLQTDPSVIYGLGSDFDGNLTRKHLQTPGPYNSYMNPGLPPTPIALPGRAAIAAALHPAPGDALYFVARGDGSHAFSATLDEHNAAVRKYQVRERARAYRSRPPG